MPELASDQRGTGQRLASGFFPPPPVARMLGCLVLSSLLLLSAILAEAAPSRPPNIVFILLDNVGPEWFGCHGSEEGVTPNIDALARGGLRFEHCYTPPVCGPSRVVLLTGRYPFHTGWVMHHDAALYGGGGLDPKREILFARPFRSAGYATGISGKWQVNNLYDEPDALRQHGFDEHLVWPGSIDRDKVTAAQQKEFQAAVQSRDADALQKANRNIESRYWNPVMIRNGRRETHPGKFGPDLFQEFALDFIRRHREQPFLLYYPMVLTHGATFTEHAVPTPLDLGTNRTQQAMFADMLRYADRLVGGVIRKLEELKLRDNTIVFVASDNGTEKDFTARCRGRLIKGGLYQMNEAGLDVALLVNCPKLIPGGRTTPLADFTDAYPTICDLAGVPLPKDVTLDGKSFAALLRGEPGAKPPRQWIFNEYLPQRVIRDERYKLYSSGEFFDVVNDWDEQHNLAASADAAVAAAREKLGKVLKSFPPDTQLPFELRSLSAFRLRAQQQPPPKP